MTDSGGEVLDRLVLDTSAYSHFRAGHPQMLDQLARAGAVIIPVTVLWIAAACLDCVGRLVTFDGDFERIPGLELTLLVPRSPEP